MTAVASLSGVVPDAAICASDPERWAGLGEPLAVVAPADAIEAAALMSWASADGIGVAIAGSGRHLGPRALSEPFVVLTTDRLTGMEIYEPADLTFTAKAGTRLRHLATELGAHRQWLPFDPPGLADRTLAGLVSAGLSGPLQAGYGPLRNHVLGATIVTGDGRVLRLGGRVVKNVAGFDVLRPVVGGRGRLGFLTSVCLRAFPEPEHRSVLVHRAESLDALAPLALAVATAPTLPVATVLASGAVVEDGAGAVLAVRLHGSAPTIEADRRTIETHLGVTLDPVEGGAAVVASDRFENADTVLDVSVLPSRLAEAVRYLPRLDPVGVLFDAHAVRGTVALAGWPADAIRSWRDRIHALGGALSVLRAPVGSDVASVSSRGSADERRLASRIAAVFDPEGVLWRNAR